ncbi:hypothetical protein [Nonomuraea sp. NPDC023979]|uniref:hypothetical protein n=1 Tax=Nonomuraea sp. NPDC023979 TaxID=3154796 RepID=UPI0033E0F362
MKGTETKGRKCVGKRRHATLQQALAALERMVEAGTFRGGIRAYECNHCGGGFHVGHRPGRRSGRRKRR